MSKHVAVLPWWPHEPSEEERVGLKSIRALCEIPLVVVLPEGCEAPPYLRPSAFERFAPQHFKSSWDYSRLLLTAEFYKRFSQFDYTVIIQSDVLLLRSVTMEDLESFSFDYIGAPWVKRDSNRQLYLSGAGNGGFSMRRNTSFISVLESPTPFKAVPLNHFSPKRGLFLAGAIYGSAALRLTVEKLATSLVRAKVHEDTFWARIAPLLHPDFTVCPPEAAARFAVEREPAFVSTFAGESGPMGAHAWRKHGGDFFLAAARARYD